MASALPSCNKACPGHHTRPLHRQLRWREAGTCVESTAGPCRRGRARCQVLQPPHCKACPMAAYRALIHPSPYTNPPPPTADFSIMKWGVIGAVTATLAVGTTAFLPPGNTLAAFVSLPLSSPQLGFPEKLTPLALCHLPTHPSQRHSPSWPVCVALPPDGARRLRR